LTEKLEGELHQSLVLTEKLEGELLKLKRTKSWKITKPLRWLSEILRSGRPNALDN